MKYLSYLLLCLTALLGCTGTRGGLTLTVHNPTELNRENEMVEVDWAGIRAGYPQADRQAFILSGPQGKEVPYQLLRNGADSIETLIFPVSLNAGESASFKIRPGNPEPFAPLVFGRLVPEREDDFAWENNRSAFRVYGPALKATGEISNGMDFWAKRTENLVIDKWYRDDLAGAASYHKDHGEGLDFYKVGRTLGMGMTAPFDHDSLRLGDNFVSAEILDEGPLRVTFRLTYDPYFAGDKTIKETRVISLDAYSYFNRITHTFESDAEALTLATGIAMHGEKRPLDEIAHADAGDGIIAYESLTDKTNGTIYAAAIRPGGFRETRAAQGHLLGLNGHTPGEAYTVHAGGGWSKAGFGSFGEWTRFVREEKEKMDHPLTVQIK